VKKVRFQHRPSFTVGRFPVFTQTIFPKNALDRSVSFNSIFDLYILADVSNEFTRILHISTNRSRQSFGHYNSYQMADFQKSFIFSEMREPLGSEADVHPVGGGVGGVRIGVGGVIIGVGGGVGGVITGVGGGVITGVGGVIIGVGGVITGVGGGGGAQVQLPMTSGNWPGSHQVDSPSEHPGPQTSVSTQQNVAFGIQGE